MDHFTLSILLGTAGFLQRLSICWRQSPVFDTFGHIYFTKCVKCQHTGPLGKIKPNVVEGGSYAHPLFMHWLLSFLDLRLLIKFQHVINPLLDAIFVFLLSRAIFAAGYDTTMNSLACLTYIFSPIWFSKLSVGPRISSFTPRLFSEILFNGWLLTIFFYPVENSIFSLLVATGFISAVLLSSKFGVQVVLFLGIAIGLLSSSLLPILSILSAFVLCMLVSRGRFWQTLKSQLTHLKWYFFENLKGELYAASRNNLAALFAWNSNLSSKQNVKTLVTQWLVKNSFTSTIIKMPLIFVAVTIFFTGIPDAASPEIYTPVFLSILLFLVINVPALLFLGEAERYLSHAAGLVCLFTTVVLIQNGLTPLIFAAILYGVAFWLLELYALNFKQPLKRLQIFQNEVTNFLSTLDGVRTIVTYPFHATSPHRIMLESVHKVFFPLLAREEKLQSLSEYMNPYPFVNLDKLDELHEKYGVDLVVIDNKNIRPAYKNWSPSEIWEPVATEIEDAQIYQTLKSSDR